MSRDEFRARAAEVRQEMIRSGISPKVADGLIRLVELTHPSQVTNLIADSTEPPPKRLPAPKLPQGMYGLGEAFNDPHFHPVLLGRPWDPQRSTDALCGKQVWMRPVFGGMVMPFEWGSTCPKCLEKLRASHPP